MKKTKAKAIGLLHWVRENQRFDLALLTILSLAIVVINFVWIILEKRPPHWDMGRHLLDSINYLSLFESKHLYGLLASYSYYPPFLYLVTIPFYLIFGSSVHTAILSNMPFVLILVFSTYGIGRRLWGRRVGLIAAIVVVSTPMLASQFKEYQIDAPLTAMIAAALYLLIRTKEFFDRRFAVMFGIVLGLGMLTKWTAVFILMLPMGYAVINALWRDIKDRRLCRTYNLILALMLTYLVSSIWYVTNQHQIIVDLTSNGVQAGAREGDPVVGTVASNLWYVKNLLSTQLQLGFTVFLATSLVFSVMNWRTTFRKNAYPILLVLGTIIFFSLLRNKDARYTLPMLPAISVLLSYWLTFLKKRLRNALSILLVAYCTFIFWSISFGVPKLPYDTTVLVGPFPIAIYAQHGYIIGAPTHENWHQEEVFKTVSSSNTARVLYYEAPDQIWLNNWGLQYFATKYRVSLTNDPLRANFLFIVGTTNAAIVGETKLIEQGLLPDGQSFAFYRRQ